MSASSSLSEVECLIVQAVIENTIDQLAIVGGTIQLSLPAHGGHHSIPLHQNATQKPLEELILREHKQHQKVLIYVHSVWILAFSNMFCPIKNDLSGNIIWLQVSGF